jgi:hypothetical protein
MVIENINSFVSWIVYSGGALLVASWVLDRIPQFIALGSEAKRLINIAVSVVLALGFYAMITYLPATLVTAIDPWFKIAVSIITLYTGQQIVHRNTKQE